MANPFGIAERTLDQIGDSTNSLNVIGGTDGRKSAYQPLVVIATDHDDYVTPVWPDNTGTPEDEVVLTANCPIFVSKRHGEPWTRGSLKDVGLEHIIHKAAAVPAVPTNVTVLYPNFDYSTFE